MKTVGLLGGMSPESTVFYYKTLNRMAKERLGGHASAKLLIHSVNFAETHAAQLAGDWQGIAEQLTEAALGLQSAGADLIAMATNTMHKCAPAIEAAIDVPFVHIATACAEALLADAREQPALLGTAFTMEERFYTDHLITAGLTPHIPDAPERAAIHRIIFEELVHGVTTSESRQTYIDIVADLKARGADSVILGCTEIGMLLNSGNSPLAPYDTAQLHCAALIQTAL